MYEISVNYIKSFKEKFMHEIIKFLESELPACDYKIEPIYLEIIFKL